MKKFILGLIVGICIAVPASIYAENVQKITAYINPDVKITIDGEPLVLEEHAILYEQRTHLPLRWVAENVMGMTVDWDQETQTVLLTTKIDETQIWPINDATPNDGTGGDGMKTKEDVVFNESYTNLLSKDHAPLEELTISEINLRIRSLNNELETFNYFLKLAADSGDDERFKPYIVEAYQDQIPIIEESISYWQGLKEQKEAQLAEEQQQSE